MGVSAEVPVPMEVLVPMEEPSEVELKGPASQSGEESSSLPSAATMARVSVEPSEGLWGQQSQEVAVAGRGCVVPPSRSLPLLRVWAGAAAMQDGR